jgi:tetratricopeptide (TPR) repeat protein
MKTTSRKFACRPRTRGFAAALGCVVAFLYAAPLVAQDDAANGASPAMREYAAALVRSLPEKPAVLLSDDAARASAVTEALGSATNKHLVVETALLASPAYHESMRQKHGGRWPALTLQGGHTALTPQQMVSFLSELGRANELFYLHPSFGFFFETYYLEPRGLVYALKPYPANATEAPVPGAALLAQQATTWSGLKSTFQRIRATLAAQPASGRGNATGTEYVAQCYSRALNWWGVELQRARKFEEASAIFAEALALNPDNVAALINREANTLWRQNRQRLKQLAPDQEAKLKLYRGMEELLAICGPVDSPEFSIELAQVFARGGLYRQASHCVQRALFYAPGQTEYELTLANVELLGGQAARARKLVQEARRRAKDAAAPLRIEMDRIEALALSSQDDFTAGEKILAGTVRQFPKEDASYGALNQFYAAEAGRLNQRGDTGAAGRVLTNGLKVIADQVAVDPKNTAALFQQGVLFMMSSNFSGAVSSFTQVLEVQKDHGAALLNRAIAHLRGNKLEDAERDYKALLERFKNDFRVYYGLGEIAYQRKDWRAAAENYEQYLRYAPPNSAEANVIRQRLEEVKAK